MTLVNARAAFEKTVTDAVSTADSTVLMVYDNVRYTTPGKTKKYIPMTVNFNRSTIKTKAPPRITTPASSSATSTFQSLLERQCCHL